MQGNNKWTEEEAKTFCDNYILNKDSVKVCMNIPYVDTDSALALCVLDIMVTNHSNLTGEHF